MFGILVFKLFVCESACMCVVCVCLCVRVISEDWQTTQAYVQFLFVNNLQILTGKTLLSEREPPDVIRRLSRWAKNSVFLV